MTDNGITISGDLNWSFDRMAREMPKIEESALKSGAYMLKELEKESLVSKMPAATKPVRVQTIRGYKVDSQEPLTEAIRQSKTKNGKVKVHALGSGKKGSSTFIARFYEEVTKPRYAKTYKGKPLKKKRYAGTVGGTHFFSSALSAYMDQVIQHISNIITNRLSLIADGRQ